MSFLSLPNIAKSLSLLNDAIEIIDEISSDYKCIFCKNILNNSMSSFCGCQYCEKCIKNYLKDGKKYCPGNTEECKENYLYEDSLNVNNAMNVKILRLTVKCPYYECYFTDSLKKMPDHIEICEFKPSLCPFYDIGCSFKGHMKTMKTHCSNDAMKHNTLILDYIKPLMESSRNNNNIQPTIISNDLITNLQLNLDNQINEVNEIKSTIQNLENENNSLRKDVEFLMQEISELKISNEARSKDEVNRDLPGFKWVVKNAYDYFTMNFDSLATLNKDMISDFFYSNQKENEGYKLCLILSSENSHGINIYVRLFICIIKGEFDDILEWPCKNTIKVKFYNSNNNAVIQSISLNFSNFNQSLFDKPENQSSSNSRKINVFTEPLVLTDIMCFGVEIL